MSTHRRTWSVATSTLALIVCLAGPSLHTDTVASAAGQREDPDAQVLVVSLDGFNPNAYKHHRIPLPNLRAMVNSGAATFEARTDYHSTQTLPNHTTMITGLPVKRAIGGHGVTWNDERRKPNRVSGAAGRFVHSVFSQVRKHGGGTALFATKPKFSLFPRSWPSSFSKVTIKDAKEGKVAAAALRDLRKHDRAFTFLHLGAPDRAGHAAGFMSKRYLKALARTDALLGDIRRAARNDVRLADLRIIVTSDHGGEEGARAHDNSRTYSNLRVPFIVWGLGIDHGNLYAMNPGYQPPAKRRPSYADPDPIRNGDVANLALGLLGIDPIRASRIGRKPTLRVTLPAQEQAPQ